MVYYRALLRRAFGAWSAATAAALQITHARERANERRADEHYRVSDIGGETEIISF